MVTAYRTEQQLEVAAYQLLDESSKGPWFIPEQEDVIADETRSVLVRDCNKAWIADVGNLNHKERLANAKLLAAAHELFSFVLTRAGGGDIGAIRLIEGIMRKQTKVA
jgi:hypothetical protein